MTRLSASFQAMRGASRCFREREAEHTNEAMRILIAIAVLAGLAALAPAVARSNPACGDTVIRDWSADGRIAGRYALPCYGQALEQLPEDMRAYSTASDDISQALQARIRETRRDGPAGDADAMSFAPEVPLPLLSAAGIALLLALVRLVAWWLRRQRVSRRHTRPVGQW
jgi:hypothetical protein